MSFLRVKTGAARLSAPYAQHILMATLLVNASRGVLRAGCDLAEQPTRPTKPCSTTAGAPSPPARCCAAPVAVGMSGWCRMSCGSCSNPW